MEFFCFSCQWSGNHAVFLSLENEYLTVWWMSYISLLFYELKDFTLFHFNRICSQNVAHFNSHSFIHSFVAKWNVIEECTMYNLHVCSFLNKQIYQKRTLNHSICWRWLNTKLFNFCLKTLKWKLISCPTQAHASTHMYRSNGKLCSYRRISIQT